MREIVFDTETTGLDPAVDRIIEIGCVELVNHLPTGAELHIYLDPGVEIAAEITSITGLTTAHLRGKPAFADICEEVTAFFGDSPVVAHNAEFDRGFLNAELARCGRPAFARERFVDTWRMAKDMFAGAPASLDALCRRFNIPLDGREKHGALIDARLLACAYLELRGGRERRFDFADRAQRARSAAAGRVARPPRPAPLAPLLTEAEAAAHAAFVASLADAIWLKRAG